MSSTTTARLRIFRSQVDARRPRCPDSWGADCDRCWRGNLPRPTFGNETTTTACSARAPASSASCIASAPDGQVVKCGTLVDVHDVRAVQAAALREAPPDWTTGKWWSVGYRLYQCLGVDRDCVHDHQVAASVDVVVPGRSVRPPPRGPERPQRDLGLCHDLAQYHFMERFVTDWLPLLGGAAFRRRHARDSWMNRDAFLDPGCWPGARHGLRAPRRRHPCRRRSVAVPG
jgi:hypothetical protein